MRKWLGTILNRKSIQPRKRKMLFGFKSPVAYLQRGSIDAKTLINWGFALMFGAAVIQGVLWWNGSGNTKSMKGNVVPQAPQTAVSQVKQSHTDNTFTVVKNSDSRTEQAAMRWTDTDIAFGGLQIGDSFNKVTELKGRPYKQTVISGQKHLFFDGLEVVINPSNTVQAIWSDGQRYQTNRGIHEGSSRQEVFSAYGSNYKTEGFEKLLLHEYDVVDRNNRAVVLRFAINGENRVEYISLRIP